MIILCTVDITTREVTIPSDQRIASYDHKVDVIRFQVETIPGFSLDTSSIKIAAQGPNKARHDYAVDPSTVQIEEETGYITFDWPIPAGVTEMPIGTFKYGDKGQLIFAVCAEIISGNTVSQAWHSDDGIITVVAHLEPEAGGGEDPEETATNAQKIAHLQTDVAVINTQVGALANGSPTPVSTVAEMTDESSVYLYTGSETGYTAGKWYYYSTTASDWLAGGTYGGVPTDTTLSISGSAADAKAVGDAINGITIEVDDTLSEQGKAADAKAVGDALAEKADADDVDALDDRVTALESGGDDVPYEERGDLYTLFASAEVESMKKTDYRLQYNSTTQAVTEQSYSAGHPAIHYIDLTKLGYPRLWVHRLTAYEWSVFADYDPDNDSYTLIATGPAGNGGKLIDFSDVPEGHYVAVSMVPAYWQTGYYIYLGRVWIKPGYASKYDGWDVPVSDEPIPCELYPVSMGYPAIYIDMSKYQDQLVRLINSGTMASNVQYGIRAYTDLAGTGRVDIDGFFSIGDFSAWFYSGQYLVLFYRSRLNVNFLNLTMGYVPIENARKAKDEGRWGAKFAFHNVDTPNELIFACAVGSLFDIDTCRTLDGYHVGLHGTTLNGHDVTQTNLADLGLTDNQYEFTWALRTMKKYGVICYVNSRGCTPEQEVDLVDRIYNYLGVGIIYDSLLAVTATEFLEGHISKYYTWASGVPLDTLVSLGAKPGRIFANASHLEGTSYTKGDIIQVKSIASGETLSNFAWDGECAYLWIHNDTPGFVRG